MVILFDIIHVTHLNFFKNTIFNLQNQGHKVLITVLDRGKLTEIVSTELPGFSVFIVGKHRGTKLSIIFQANFFRFLKMLLLINRLNPDFGVSVGSFIVGATLKLRGRYNIQFDDDPERKLNVFLEKLTSNKLFFPVFYKNTTNKVRNYKALKEWAYLSPKYFIPNMNILKKYSLEPYSYFFVREVSTGSLNYTKQKDSIIAGISQKFPSEFNVILSLEDKRNRSLYPDNWIILQEPVEDIHSLIYFSKLLISSGDSMAREGAMLGVPSIYCGIREMAANKIMIEKGMLLYENIKKVLGLIESIVKNKIKVEYQVQFREKLKNEWIDVTEFIVQQIKQYENK